MNGLKVPKPVQLAIEKFEEDLFERWEDLTGSSPEYYRKKQTESKKITNISRNQRRKEAATLCSFIYQTLNQGSLIEIGSTTSHELNDILRIRESDIAARDRVRYS